MKHVDAFLLLTSAHGATAHGERTGPFGGWTNSHLHVGTIDPVSGTAGLVKSTDGARIRTPFVSDLANGGITKLFHDGIVRSNSVVVIQARYRRALTWCRSSRKELFVLHGSSNNSAS